MIVSARHNLQRIHYHPHTYQRARLIVIRIIKYKAFRGGAEPFGGIITAQWACERCCNDAGAITNFILH